MEQWKIQRDRARCEKPGCPLAADREYYAILRLPDCVRIERCQSCFEEMRRQSGTMPFHWMVRRNLDGTRSPTLDMESLRALFDRLGEVEEEAEEEAAPAVAGAAADGVADTGADAGAADAAGNRRTAAGLRYLVALLLLRKRRLRMVDPRTKEQEAADLLVVDPQVEGMEPVALHAPELDPERIANLREELTAAIGDESGQHASAAD